MNGKTRLIHCARTIALAWAAPTLAWTAPAIAGEVAADAEPAASTSDDIVVTARRKEERLLDVPVAITALSGAALQDKRVDNLEALTFVAPGLVVQGSSFGKAVPGYAIRGQRSAEPILTLDPSVGVYFAEQVQQRPHGTNGAMFDLASVEVLKGPQGTLFGRNTTGGAILINPARPTFKTEAMIQIEAGSYDLKRGTAMINLPLSETLALRLAGRITRRDGFVKTLVGAPYTANENRIRTGLGFDAMAGSVAGDRTDDERTEAGRISLLWKPSASFTSYTVAAYYHEDDAGTGFGLYAIKPGVGFAASTPELSASYARQVARPDFWTTEDNFHPQTRVKSFSISNTSTLDLGGLRIKNIFGYRSVDTASVFDFDGSSAAAFESGNRMKSNQWTEELQASGNISQRINYIAGIYWFRESGFDIQYSTLGGFRANDGSATNQSYSAYAQFNARLTDKLTLTAGGRYTIDERELTARNVANGACRVTNDAGVPFPIGACSRDFNKTFRSPSWLLSLDYKPDNNTLIYLAHRRGYRSGGWNLRLNSPLTQLPIRPETVYDIELGAKAKMLDGALSINGAVYQQWYKDIQRSVPFTAPDGSFAVVTTNAAKAEVRGGELEVNMRPVQWLELGGSIVYVDARYKSFIQGVADYTQSTLAGVPKWTYTLSGRVYLPVKSAIGDVSIGADYFHQSELDPTDLNKITVAGVTSRTEQPLAGYGVLNASIDWKNLGGMPLDLSVYAKNLTKERYYTGGFSLWASQGLSIAGYGPPRQFGASLTYHFGR